MTKGLKMGARILFWEDYFKSKPSVVNRANLPNLQNIWNEGGVFTQNI
jgi:hypothetical protein